MAVRSYPAIVEAGDGHGLGVMIFPDLPGCVSAGATVQEAAARAEEALALHLGGMIEDGEPLAEPPPLDRLPADPDVREVARLLVHAELPAGPRASTSRWTRACSPPSTAGGPRVASRAWASPPRPPGARSEPV